MTEFIYRSPFHEFILEVIRQKSALGYKYDSSERVLYHFDQFCLAYGCTEPVCLKNSSLPGVRNAPMRHKRLYRTGHASYGNLPCI
jgi:hypothetical protein